MTATKAELRMEPERVEVRTPRRGLAVEPDPEPGGTDEPGPARPEAVSPVGGDYLLHSAMLVLGRFVSQTVDFYNRRFALERRDVQRIYGNLARVYQYKGERDKAIAAYQEILKLSPRDPETHFQLAQLYLEKGQVERATTALRSAVRLRPGHAESHFRLGQCLSRLGQLDGALESLTRAVELDPKHARALQRLSLLLDKKGRTDEAISVLERAVALAPGEPRYQQQLGFLYETAGRHQDAVKCFKAVLELESQMDDEP